MHESEIKKQCITTWALNYGQFNTHTETGAPPKTKTLKIDKRGRVSMRRPEGETREAWEEVKGELRMYQRYARSLVCRGGDSRRAHDNGAKIARGLEAGAVLAGIESRGTGAKLWAFLAYREADMQDKAQAFKLLAAILIDEYMSKHNLKESDSRRVTLIALYQLGSALNEIDKRFPPPSGALGDYSNPRDFKYRHKHIFYDLAQMIRDLDRKVKLGAGNAGK